MKPIAGITALLLCLLFFFSPVVPWVAHLAPAWWWPFVLWSLIIVLLAIANEPVGRKPEE